MIHVTEKGQKTIMEGEKVQTANLAVVTHFSSSVPPCKE
jgi:hypothetical protein